VTHLKQGEENDKHKEKYLPWGSMVATEEGSDKKQVGHLVLLIKGIKKKILGNGGEVAYGKKEGLTTQ